MLSPDLVRERLSGGVVCGVCLSERLENLGGEPLSLSVRKRRSFRDCRSAARQMRGQDWL
ncbi:hypothetical protein [Rubritalea tangerina]|uniref:hypothetical protein n=1 Tax=Rubritalea tangerina TaxID=430798 RepID=UPI0036096CAA